MPIRNSRDSRVSHLRRPKPSSTATLPGKIDKKGNQGVVHRLLGWGGYHVSGKPKADVPR